MTYAELLRSQGRMIRDERRPVFPWYVKYATITSFDRQTIVKLTVYRENVSKEWLIREADARFIHFNNEMIGLEPDPDQWIVDDFSAYIQELGL